MFCCAYCLPSAIIHKSFSSVPLSISQSSCNGFLIVTLLRDHASTLVAYDYRICVASHIVTNNNKMIRNSIFTRRAKQSKAEQSKAKQSRAKQAEQERAEQGRAEQSRARQSSRAEQSNA
jgi:hypothetical protein